MENFVEIKQLEVGGVKLTLTLKNIKNVHLRVFPPRGDVHVSAPIFMSRSELMTLLEKKVQWIQKQKKRIQMLPPVVERKTFADGEYHYFQGKRYVLKVVMVDKKEKIAKEDDCFILFINANTAEEKKQQLFDAWYRQQMKQCLPLMIKKYEVIMGVHVQKFGIKRMKTRWGSCNPSAKRIWLSLDLARFPEKCLEYVLVHEMTHLLEPSHNHRFKAFMNRFMPEWENYETCLTNNDFH